MLFHGELVNEEELQSALAEGGDPPASGAAGIVERLYRRHQHRLGALLKGAFCAAIVDESSGALTLLTDRLGSYPLYWFRTDDRFVSRRARASCAIIRDRR